MIVPTLGLKRLNENKYFYMIFFKKLHKIQAISFDLDDTLYENFSIILQAEKSLVDYMHDQYPITKNLDKNFWREQRKQQIHAEPNLKHDMSQLRRLTLKSGFAQLGLTNSALDEATEKCYQHFYFERSNFRLNENIHSLLKTLSSQLPLVAITNGNVNLQQIGLDSYFSACFNANIKLPMKPDIAMFEAAQLYLNIPHKHILHVGDNLEKDIYGALKAGFQAAWYAHDRVMNLNHEPMQVVPHVQLKQLEQLTWLI